MENDRIGNKELLIVWSDKRCEKVYRQLWYVLKDKESYRGTSRKAEVEWNTRKAIDISDSGLYYQVVISSWKEYNSSSLW